MARRCWARAPITRRRASTAITRRGGGGGTQQTNDAGPRASQRSAQPSPERLAGLTVRPRTTAALTATSLAVGTRPRSAGDMLRCVAHPSRTLLIRGLWVRVPRGPPAQTRFRDLGRGMVRGMKPRQCDLMPPGQGRRQRSRGSIDQLPSGTFRVRVYAGVDPSRAGTTTCVRPPRPPGRPSRSALGC